MVKKLGAWLVFNRRRLVYGLVIFTFISTILGSLGLVALFAYYSVDLPNPNNVIRREGFVTKIYDRNEKLLYDLYKDVKRSSASWNDIPVSLRQATVAVEDKDFYKHQGFDPLAPLRIAKNIVLYRKLIGGSSLTQQLVKNVLLNSDRKLSRKIREFILAVTIDAKFSKDDVLMMYLNEAPYGGAVWGASTASETYFGKPLSQLSLTESAILAGIPQRPNVFSPFSKTPTAYIARVKHVLTRMVEDGYISQEMADSSFKEASSYKFFVNKTTIQAPHFVFWLRDELSKRYGENAIDLGLKVVSSLDLDMQNKLQELVTAEIDKAEKLGVSNGASLVLDPRDGQVLAMVGSRGYYSDKIPDGQFNVVTSKNRQPGSSIKPITYLLGLRNGLTPASMVLDTPVVLPVVSQKDYEPKNYTGKFLGPMPLRNALGNSINTTAVKILATVGVESFLRQAFSMGLTSLEPNSKNLATYGYSATLGGVQVQMLELATAYSSFANGGKKVDSVGILKVEDRNGRVVEEFKPTLDKTVMTPQEAFLISNILSDNSAREATFGAVNGLVIPDYQVAVKTGTTNDKRDNWAIGWTPNLLVAAWVGNNDNSPMLKVASGVSGATPIWRKAMLMFLPKRQKQDFSIPNSIVRQDVDTISGYNSHDGFPVRQDYFIDGTQPRVDDPIHLKLKICRDKPGLAPPEDVASGNYNEKEYIKLVEQDPISKDGRNRWQEGVDKWISSLPQDQQDKYRPPTEYCRGGGGVGVNIDTPTDRSTVGNDFIVRVITQSSKKIIKVTVSVNGVEKNNKTERPFDFNLNLPDGTYSLKVRAEDKDGASSGREIRIGVNKPWDWAPSPTLTPTLAPTQTPVLTPTVGLTFTPTVGLTPTPTVGLTPTPTVGLTPTP